MFVLAMMFVYDSSETNFFRPARRGISDFLLGQLIGGFNDFYWCSTGEDSHVDENLFKSVLKKKCHLVNHGQIHHQELMIQLLVFTGFSRFMVDVGGPSANL